MQYVHLTLVGVAIFVSLSNELLLLIDGTRKPCVRSLGEVANVLLNVDHFALKNLNLVGDGLVFLAQVIEFRRIGTDTAHFFLHLAQSTLQL